MDYDAELQLHVRALFEACSISERDRILDIGCGTGLTTRAAARLAVRGNALGVDIMEQSIRTARAIAARDRLRNVRFEHADAQAHAFPPESFDLAISRYGTMFFSNPIGAFRNIRNALSPKGRLAMMVWQSHERNEWSVVIEASFAPYFSPQPRDRQHFSLADPPIVKRMMEAAGFARVEFNEVREPVYYGADIEAALSWVRSFRFIEELMKRLDAQARDSVLERLRAAMSQHAGDAGIWFGASEWIITAQNA